MSVLWFIITTLVGGLIIGWLGKVVAPGSKDNIAFLPMWIVGIIGMLLGSFLYYWIFGVQKGFDGNAFNTTKGIDWWRHVWQIVVTAILVAVATTVMPSTRRR
ncbi:hypothetical protein [Nocardioides sp.]|uniref:hypothetical protein n=1 Tax=Nocardioides sp. TaxID=35761 RepID=UPI002639F870|nr:hypothetical protein [Nocardioides sp.]